MRGMVSVVIPAHNEAGGIAAIVDAAFETIRSHGYAPDVIVVDDGSTDATFARAVERAGLTPGVRVLRLSRNFGKESAIAAGLLAAEGDAAIVMDADFQHPVSTIPLMLTAWQEGFDVVEAYKVQHARGGWFDNLNSRLFYFLFRFLTRFDISQATDFKLLDRRVLTQWKQMPEEHLFFRGMVAWLGFKRKRVPVIVPPRAEGTSKWSRLHLLVYAMRSIISFSPFLLYLASLGTLALSLVTIGLGIRGVWVKLSGQVVDGLTIILLTQLLIGTVLMLVLSAICAYLSLIFEELKKRPRFVLAETFPRVEQDHHHAIGSLR